MQCRNCSGNEFTETSNGNHKCVYCGTLFYIEPRKNENVKQPAGYKPAKILILIVAVLGLSIAIGIVSFTARRAPSTGTKTDSAENHQTFTNESKLPLPKGEIAAVEAIPDIIGNVYFIVMCKNTGDIAMERPQVTIRLFSNKNEKIASGTGYAFKNYLNPGEISPVVVLITNCPRYSRHEIEFKPELPYIIPEGGVFIKRFTGTFSDVSLKQVSSANEHLLRGKIRNSSGFDALYVQVAAVLYDKNNRIAGYGYTFIKEKTLKPGDWDFFEINLTTVRSAPDHYTLFYDANIH